MAKKSDRQQCSDDWKELTRSTKPVVVFDKKYEGFESLYDIERDICEAIDANPILEGEFQGTVQVIIVYTPKGKTK